MVRQVAESDGTPWHVCTAHEAQVGLQGMRASALLSALQDSCYFFTSFKKKEQNKTQLPATERTKKNSVFRQQLAAWALCRGKGVVLSVCKNLLS